MEEEISGIEDMKEEMDSLVKENVKSKYLGTKYLGTLVQYEKSKSNNNGNSGRRENPGEIFWTISASLGWSLFDLIDAFWTQFASI